MLTQSKRNLLAETLKDYRKCDRLEMYQTRRSFFDYMSYLNGLTATLNHVETTSELKNGIILDIGTGNGIALNELSKKTTLTCIGTSLTLPPKYSYKTKGLSRIILTPVERLRGITDSSVSLAIAVYSLDYSALPAQAVRMFDRVLLPGGILKACFNEPIEQFMSNMQSRDVYGRFFKALGYEIVTNNSKLTHILVVRKPGYSQSSKSLYEIVTSDIAQLKYNSCDLTQLLATAQSYK